MKLTPDSSRQCFVTYRKSQKQKKYYSGKKKNYTFKNQLIVTPNGTDIVDIEVGKPGSSSDISLWREQQKKFDNKQRFKGDFWRCLL